MSTIESLGPIAATMSGGLAIILTTWNATHQGEYLGIPPTGKQITHRQIDLFSVANGQTVEYWNNVADVKDLLIDIGYLMPRNTTMTTIRTTTTTTDTTQQSPSVDS